MAVCQGKNHLLAKHGTRWGSSSPYEAAWRQSQGRCARFSRARGKGYIQHGHEGGIRHRLKYLLPGSFPYLGSKIQIDVQCQREQGYGTLWDEKQRWCNEVMVIIEVEGERCRKRSDAGSDRRSHNICSVEDMLQRYSVKPIERPICTANLETERLHRAPRYAS